MRRAISGARRATGATRNDAHMIGGSSTIAHAAVVPVVEDVIAGGGHIGVIFLPASQVLKQRCSTFASAVAIAAGLTDIIPTECGCEKHIALFKALGSWQVVRWLLKLEQDHVGGGFDIGCRYQHVMYEFEKQSQAPCQGLCGKIHRRMVQYVCQRRCNRRRAD